MHLNLMVRKDTGEPISMPAFRLSPGIPRNGATCLSMGYHDMKAEADGNQPYHYTIGRTYSASKGIIEEIHFPRLDNVLMPFPCFRTSMRHEPGMSGGPVLSEDGAVLGVVCSAIHGQPIYYVSLIGLSLLLQVDAAKSDGSSGKVFLYDFVSGGAVGADATIDQLGIHRDGGTLQISFGIPPIFTGNLGI